MIILELAKKYKQYGIDMRREFHMNPEPSLKEFRTSERIVEELTKLGIECRIAADTGVIATIKGKGEGRTIALRADMDALEVSEQVDAPYKSIKDGLMHACGHDAHSASLLMAAAMIVEKRNSFSGEVRLIFQPAEENARGAKKMIEAGCMDNVDGIFGIHVWNGIEVGKISVESGPRMASAGIFKINVIGKGGHGSLPHQGVDAVVIGSSIVQNLQTIVSREISPMDAAVITVGIFNSGTRFNVMAGEAYLEGTTRCFSMDINDDIGDMIARVAKSTAEGMRGNAYVEYEQLVKPVINDGYMSEIAYDAVIKTFGSEAIANYDKLTVGEDFSFYSEKAPSMFAFVGAKDKTQDEYFPHHHPKFSINEDAVEVSAVLYSQFALDFLNK